MKNSEAVSDLNISFKGLIWKHQGKAAWFFITLPISTADKVKFFSGLMGHKRRGWGSVRVAATIGHTTWKTSIFPDKNSKSYLLPVKAQIRNKEKLSEGRDVDVKIAVIL